MESHLKVELPEALKNIFLSEASGLLLKWFAPPEIFGEKCTRGYFHLLSPIEIIDLYEDMLSMVSDLSVNNSEIETNEGLQVLVADWPNWIPIIRFPNGDAFCVDIKNNHSIVFLEHDVMDGGPNIHGTKIAEDLDDLLNNWNVIAFVDYYDWSECVDDNRIDIENSDFSSIRKLIK
ncbi:SMI1/KNR4 family protein [Paenibacillus sp. GCM10028914]|uniref:SMI1/KNR4 family protein n=1 Tax=Paenibacillus sp. GCM10028914 TaxID=3273416 RepID=UPI00360B6203